MEIQNGYRLAPGTDPFAVAQQLREALDPVRDRLDAALVAELTVDAIDGHLMDGQPVPACTMSAVLREWRAQQAKLGEYDREHDPNGFTASIGPDPLTGRLNLLAHTAHPDYMAELDALPSLEDFTSAGERPDDLTDEDWDGRRAAWDRIIPTRAPYRTMLTFKLRSPMDGDPGRFARDRSPLVLEHAPTRLQRARRILTDRGFAAVVRARGIDPLSRAMSTLALVERHLGDLDEALAAELPELTWDLAVDGAPARPALPRAAEEATAELLRRIDQEDH